MDPAVQRALNDKLYDKRKVGALEWVTLSLLPFSLTHPPISHPRHMPQSTPVALSNSPTRPKQARTAHPRSCRSEGLPEG